MNITIQKKRPVTSISSWLQQIIFNHRYEGFSTIWPLRYFHINLFHLWISHQVDCFLTRNASLHAFLLINVSPVQHIVTTANFGAIDGKTLQETVQHLKTSICCLETLSTSFFKMSLVVLNRIYWIVNPSVLFQRPFFKVFENKLLGLSLKRTSEYLTQLKNKQTKTIAPFQISPSLER